jgi:hypothetical protein
MLRDICVCSRPAVSERCLSLTPGGNVRYQKTPYRESLPHERGRLSPIRRTAVSEETVGPRRRDHADTCTPGEKSGIKRIQSITREQGTAPNRFVRVIDEISLTQSSHQITARKNSGSWSGCRVADCGRIDRLGGAPKVGALSDIVSVDEN